MGAHLRETGYASTEVRFVNRSALDDVYLLQEEKLEASTVLMS